MYWLCEDGNPNPFPTLPKSQVIKTNDFIEAVKTYRQVALA